MASLRADLFRWSAEDGSLDRITSERDFATPTLGRRCVAGQPPFAAIAAGATPYGSIWQRAQSGSPGIRRETTIAHESPSAPARSSSQEQSGDRWRIARVPPTGEYPLRRSRRRRVTKFDATFDVDGGPSLIGGWRHRHLERLNPTTRLATRLTAVTGAPAGADVRRGCRYLWFLSLQAHGTI